MIKAHLMARTAHPSDPDNMDIQMVSFYLEYPLVIHAEVLRHRMLGAHSVASSRAIPTAEYIRRAKWVPDSFTGRRPGMAGIPGGVRGWAAVVAHAIWRGLGCMERWGARTLSLLGVAKEYANRRVAADAIVCEVVTGQVKWFDDFIRQRSGSGVQPEIKELASEIYEAMRRFPTKTDKIHDPYRHYPVPEYNIYDRAGRVARLSYGDLNTSEAPQLAMDRGVRLLQERHMTPFEHLCFALDDPRAVSRGLIGWKSSRVLVER